MFRAVLRAFLVASCAALTLQVQGCSIVGLTVGAISDSRQPAIGRGTPAEVVRFHPGDRIVVFGRDSSKVEGVYEGPAEVDSVAYRESYERWRTTTPEGSGLPALGELVRFPSAGLMADDEGLFRGFVHHGVEIRAVDTGKMEVRRIGDFGRMTTSAGQNVPSSRLRDLEKANALPLRTALRVAAADGVRVIPLDEIALVEAPTHPNGARQGFVYGLAIDGVVVLAAVATASSYRGPFEGWSGCESPSPVY